MKNKVTIVGAGMVGSTVAYSLIAGDICEEIAIIDINEKLVNAQVLDLQHSVPFQGSCNVSVGSIDDYSDSSAVVITCGASQKPGQTRLDLVKQNAAIIKAIMPDIFEKNPDAVVVMVTNPVDVLTQIAVEMFPDKKSQILGTGTLLDSARLKHLLSQRLGINAKSINAYIVGEHGDSELPLWSTASVGNMNLELSRELTRQDKHQIFEDARGAAYAIIEGKQATYYAIGAGTAQLLRAILHNEREVMPVSYYQEGINGVSDICLSMPAVIGRGGIIGTLRLKLTDSESRMLENSGKILKQTLSEI